MDPAVGFVHALFEVAAATLTKGRPDDKEGIRKPCRPEDRDRGRTAGLDERPGAQRRQDPAGRRPVAEGRQPFALVVVSNKENPEIPVGGKVEPLR